MKFRQLTVVTGLLITLVGLVAAYRFQYKHFYEILLLGVVIALFQYCRRLFRHRIAFLQFYVLSVIAGFLGDYFVIRGYDLWYYNYTDTWEYLLLYLFVYPFGGLTLVMTHIFLKHYFNLTIREKYLVDPKLLLKLEAMAIAVTLLWMGLMHSVLDLHMYILTVYGAIGVVAVLNGMLLAAREPDRYSLADQFNANFKNSVIVMVLATLVQMVLHELPNVISQQWVYQNLPLQNIAPLGIPILVIVGWLFLYLVPVGLYYYVYPKDVVNS